jgi:hypothetical protein
MVGICERGDLADMDARIRGHDAKIAGATSRHVSAQAPERE